MASKIKKTNLKRLASLSALGAGALGVAAGTADAGTPAAEGIVYSGIVDEKVGFGASYGAQATIVGPSSAVGRLVKSSLRISLTFDAVLHWVNAFNPNHGTSFHFLGTDGFPAAFPRGAKFGMPAPPIRRAEVTSLRARFPGASLPNVPISTPPTDTSYLGSSAPSSRARVRMGAARSQPSGWSGWSGRRPNRSCLRHHRRTDSRGIPRPGARRR
jgi:hypothetical protein